MTAVAGTGAALRWACRGSPARALPASAAIAGAAQEVSIKVLVNDDPISDYDIDQRERFLAITTQQQPSPALEAEGDRHADR